LLERKNPFWRRRLDLDRVVEAKKERKPNLRVLREMLRRDESVDSEEEPLEAARSRVVADEGMAAAAAAAAASCSLDCRLSARRRRELSGLRRRGSG
jgi:hypothetical protein